MKKSFVLTAAFAAGLLSFSACDGLVDNGNGGGTTPGGGGLVLNVSKSIIQANGTDAAVLEVLYNDEPVTEGVTIYDADNNIVELENMTFTTTQTGTYKFWASYGTSFTETVTVTAIAFEVPVLPDDPQPEATAFARKVFLTQFTGTGCGYCPGMITILRSVLADEDYSSRVVLAAVHQYNSDDPAYLSDANLASAMGVQGFPSVVADMNLMFTNYNSESALKTLIDNSYNRTAALAGISASAHSDGNTLVVTASVKAAQTAEFRVGAWLLEDGIYGSQSNYRPSVWTGDYNTHDNCVRIADSRVSSSNYTGYSLGTISAGETAEHAFVMTLDESWVTENLHLVLFVTTPEGNSWVVNNAVACPVNGTVEFDYE